MHKLEDSVSKAVKDKLFLFPETVIGKKGDSEMSSDTSVAPGRQRGPKVSCQVWARNSLMTDSTYHRALGNKLELALCSEGKLQFKLDKMIFIDNTRLLRWLSGKEYSCQTGDAGDAGLIPRSGRSPRGGNGNPLQCSCLGNPMDRGA